MIHLIQWYFVADLTVRLLSRVFFPSFDVGGT